MTNPNMKLYTIYLLLEHDHGKSVYMFKYIPKKNDS